MAAFKMRPLVRIALVLSLMAQPIHADSWQQAVRNEIGAIERAVAPYRDIRQARADGWRRSTGHVPLMGEHWARRDGVDYVVGDALDLRKPSNLIYADIGGRMELIAVSYVVRIGANDPMPPGFSGPADVWHVHNLDQILAALGEKRPLIARLGSRWVSRNFAQDGNRRLAMVHVWLNGNNPAGPFENLNPTLPYRRLGLGPAYADGASLDAAQGVALAHPDGCDNELDGKLWLAAVTGQKKRALGQICRQMQSQVRASLGRSPTELNRVAADAWRIFDQQRFMLLTNDERRRMLSIVEGAGGTCSVVQ
ncbi:MAG: hypothetical protein AAFP85_00980 [Pseudomonadota bacterium]